MQMRRDRHPIPRIRAPRTLPHPPNPLPARNGGIGRAGWPSPPLVEINEIPRNLRQMPVKRKKLPSTPRPNMLHNNMLPKIRRTLVLHNFRDPAIEHAKHIILWHKRRLFAFKVGIRGAVREDHPRRLPRRRDVDRRDVTAAVESFSAITRPTRLTVISMHARSRKKLLGRTQEKMVRGRPADLQGGVAR